MHVKKQAKKDQQLIYMYFCDIIFKSITMSI